MGDLPLLPFLVYHDVTEEPRNIYDLRVGEFTGHLDLIQRSGWSTVSLGAFLDWQRGAVELPRKALVLTFDDGYSSHGNAVSPLLVKRGMTATFFISAGMVGTDGYLSMAQVQRMSREGMEIGSHGLSHRPLSLMSDAALRRELTASRRILQDGVGGAIDLLSAPRGSCSHRVREFASLAGYRAVCTSRISYNSRSSDPLDLGRIWIRGRKDIEAVTRGKRARVGLQRFIQAGRELTKTCLGYELYNRMRRGLLGDRAEKE